MMKHFTYIPLIFLLLVAFSASTVHADAISDAIQNLQNATSTAETSVAVGFSRDGVYGCTGAAYGAVGMQGPGGAHVPTFDDALHDQSRLLTYKECLLDGIVNSMRETLISFIIKSVVRWSNQGFDGNPAYVTNLPLHLLEQISDPEAARILSGPETEVLAGPFRRNVRVALAKDYSTITRNRQNTLRCDIADDALEALSSGDFYGAGGLKTFYKFTTNAACNPLFAYNSARNELDQAIGAEINRERTQLDWAGGFRTVERNKIVDLGGGESASVRRIVTPGFMIAEHLRQTLGTGLRQSENADEIDEIISALMANIGTEMLTDIEGLSGLSSSFSGKSSYIDRLAADAAARTRGNMTGAAASIVNNVIRIEQEYAQARQGSVTSLIQSRRQLETWENTCWTGLMDKAKEDLKAQVCPAPPLGGGIPLGGGVTCNATVTEEVATDAIAIRVPSAGSITVEGRASRGGSIIDVAISGGSEALPLIQPTVLTDGTWKTGATSLATIPDGTITVSVTETLPGGGGTLAPIVATVDKKTTITGIELTPPATLPSVTITAVGSGRTESRTFTPTIGRSRSVTNENINPILDLIRENVHRSSRALEALSQIRNALASTTSASAQRFILEQLDQLVAARVLHTESQLRQARSQGAEIEAAMKQLLEETREGWEAGWCKPENWEQQAN